MNWVDSGWCQSAVLTSLIIRKKHINHGLRMLLLRSPWNINSKAIRPLQTSYPSMNRYGLLLQLGLSYQTRQTTLSVVCVNMFYLYLSIIDNTMIVYPALSRIHRNEVSLARVMGKTLISDPNLRYRKETNCCISLNFRTILLIIAVKETLLFLSSWTTIAVKISNTNQEITWPFSLATLQK